MTTVLGANMTRKNEASVASLLQLAGLRTTRVIIVECSFLALWSWIARLFAFHHLKTSSGHDFSMSGAVLKKSHGPFDVTPAFHLPLRSCPLASSRFPTLSSSAR